MTPTDAIEAFIAARKTTEALAKPLSAEDCLLQALPDVSPTKWHLAHTSWFFEEFVLVPFAPHYQLQNKAYLSLFNSYYETAAAQFWPRPKRGQISRPSLAEVHSYRQAVTKAVVDSSSSIDEAHRDEWLRRIELGIHHEQQHQELILTDILANFAVSPLSPVYRTQAPNSDSLSTTALPDTTDDWLAFGSGLRTIGHDGPGFAFDNERPRHQVFVEDFGLARHLVTNRQYLAFVDAGGYAKPELWLSDGWTRLKAEAWTKPLYWRFQDGNWWEMTLGGLVRLQLDAPVCHLSYFEANAYASWRKARLPTEAEWECAAAAQPVVGNFLESAALRTLPASASSTGEGPCQLFGDVWEWTQSAYLPYPRARPLEGTLGEYNAKFMSNQMVLRGGSCASSARHLRATYRNFFAPETRWQFSGVRLATDL